MGTLPLRGLKLLFYKISRNPLESGQCFSPTNLGRHVLCLTLCRNPLESGQCFSLEVELEEVEENEEESQSPRIGSMFLTRMDYHFQGFTEKGRNPLESGQCFSPSFRFPKNGRLCGSCRNPLESGQCFSRYLIIK